MTVAIYFSRRHVMATLSFFLCIATLPGCGDSNTASVHGVVNVNGKPLEYGSVRFDMQQGAGFGTVIKDGEYRTDRGVPGSATVTVAAMAKPNSLATPEEIRAGGGIAAGAGFTPIPEDHPKQGQSVEIKAGENEVNFDF